MEFRKEKMFFFLFFYYDPSSARNSSHLMVAKCVIFRSERDNCLKRYFLAKNVSNIVRRFYASDACYTFGVLIKKNASMMYISF